MNLALPSSTVGNRLPSPHSPRVTSPYSPRVTKGYESILVWLQSPALQTLTRAFCAMRFPKSSFSRTEVFSPSQVSTAKKLRMHDISFQHHEVLYANVVVSVARHVPSFARKKNKKQHLLTSMSRWVTSCCVQSSKRRCSRVDEVEDYETKPHKHHERAVYAEKFSAVD